MTAADVALAELIHGQESNFFALISAKEELTTRDGKPYFRVAFRDAGREVSFPIWNDTSWSTACREHWTVGEFYKLRAQYRETNYGGQLEIRKIRPVTPEDEAEGFYPAMCLPQSRFDPAELFDEPTAALDAVAARRVEAVIRQGRDRGAAILLVTHDDVQAARLADRTLTMADGRLVAPEGVA